MQPESVRACVCECVCVGKSMCGGRTDLREEGPLNFLAEMVPSRR